MVYECGVCVSSVPFLSVVGVRTLLFVCSPTLAHKTWASEWQRFAVTLKPILTNTLFIILIKYLLILCHEFRCWTVGFRGIFLLLFYVQYIVFIKILKFNFKLFFFGAAFGCLSSVTHQTARSRIKVCATNGKYLFMVFYLKNSTLAFIRFLWLVQSLQMASTHKIAECAQMCAHCTRF